MKGKRDRLGIINDILEIVRDKAQVKPTQVMYKANLSHEMLTSYLNELLTKGFLVEHSDKAGRKTYALTEKGFHFLRDYKIIKGFVESYGLQE
ncbi:hypothetical protein J4419_03720 [Candidatus Woesearchaeota archaeon]|nr:hypothetical protein [Candidatus Woesearchaeota archaeon]